MEPTMTSKKTFQSRKSTLLRSMGVAGIAALTTLLGLPVHAASSFPNHPLLTGGNALPPNILMILDDSGSMDRSWMWADKDTSSGTSDTVTDRSYVNNSLYYNPATIYRPWRTASTALNVSLDQADFTSVSNSTTSRPEERRVGKECGSTFRSRWSP